MHLIEEHRQNQVKDTVCKIPATLLMFKCVESYKQVTHTGNKLISPLTKWREIAKYEYNLCNENINFVKNIMIGNSAKVFD